jgi:hypothetical protein
LDRFAADEPAPLAAERTAVGAGAAGAQERRGGGA